MRQETVVEFQWDLNYIKRHWTSASPCLTPVNCPKYFGGQWEFKHLKIRQILELNLCVTFNKTLKLMMKSFFLFLNVHLL